MTTSKNQGCVGWECLTSLEFISLYISPFPGPARPTGFVADHGVLLGVLQDSRQCGYGLSVLHLSQAVGQLVLQ